MYSTPIFKFRAIRLVILVLNCSERWRVEKAWFSRFACKSLFSGVSLTVLQSQLINIDSLRFVISLLRQVSSEDFGSKS
jgi:hypothetical protein